MGLDVDVVGAEDLLRALDRQRLRLVDEFASAVIPLAGVSLGVLVGQHRSRGFQDRFADEILGGDHLELVRLPLGLLPDDLVDLRVGLLEERHPVISLAGRPRALRFLEIRLDPADLVEPRRVPVPLERLRQEQAETPLRVPGFHGAGAEDRHVGVVVQAGVLRRRIVVQQRRAHAGELVGRDRHPEARAANQHAGVRRPFGDAAGHRRREIGVIDRGRAPRPQVFRLDPHPRDRIEQAALQLHPGVVGSDDDAACMRGHRFTSRTGRTGGRSSCRRSRRSWKGRTGPHARVSRWERSRGRIPGPGSCSSSSGGGLRRGS